MESTEITKHVLWPEVEQNKDINYGRKSGKFAEISKWLNDKNQNSLG